MAYKYDGFFFAIFLAMDACRECQYLNQLWSKGQAPWKAW